jgi:cytochrome P450
MLRLCLGATMRDPKVFGTNPDTFDPSRWMTDRALDDSRTERVQNMTNVLDLIFGSGTSKCLGQQVALLELVIVLSKVSSKQTGQHDVDEVLALVIADIPCRLPNISGSQWGILSNLAPSSKEVL